MSSDLDRGWGNPSSNPGEGCYGDVKRSLQGYAKCGGHHVNGPDTGKNSGGRLIKKGRIVPRGDWLNWTIF